MKRGSSKYYNSLSDIEKEELLSRIYELYIKENKTILETSEILGIDFYIVRYAIRNNIGGNLKKSKEDRYKTVFDKCKKTNIEKYGCEYPIQSDVVKEHLSNTFYRKYGVYHNKQIGKSAEEIERIYSRDKFTELVMSLDPDDRTIENIKRISNYSETPIYSAIKRFDLDDKIKWKSTDYPESQITSFLTRSIEDIRIIHHYHGWSRAHSSRYEIDLYLPDYKIGIEFNGIYYHQIKYRGNMYHQEKSLDAINSDIFLYHIWENDWYNDNKREIIKSQLLNILGKSKERIYARKCIVREISSKDASCFLNKNHIQGYRSSKYYLGLYYNEELVSVMTFGDNYFIRKNHDIELLRFANKLYTNVVGGASKLFKYFIRKYNPDKIISYCNIDTGRGILYPKLGFVLDSITPPNYFWVDRSNGNTITRYQAQNMNEKEMSRDDRYFKLSNSGNYKFIWSREGVSNDRNNK